MASIADSLTEGHIFVLREIGWSKWDPIGLIEDRKHCDDEYNQYLKEAVERCKRGTTLQELTEYLVLAETVTIGLNIQPGTEPEPSQQQLRS